MLKIAVCDDDTKILQSVDTILSDYFKMNDIEYLLDKYNDGNDLLASAENFDIIFLDIEMEHSNGIDIAEHIRKLNSSVPIVYITNYTDYWRRAFKVHAFGFITKPLKDSDFKDLLDDYFNTFSSRHKDIANFITSNGPICINYDDILYFFFKSKRNVDLFTKDGKYLLRENLSDIYDKLDKKWFYQPRRECIVNLKNVKKLQNDYAIVMLDGSILPLAQRKKEEFMKKLADAFMDVVKG